MDEFGSGRPGDRRNLFGINIGSVLGGVGGFIVGGPAGAAAGAKLGGRLAGGSKSGVVPGVPGAFTSKGTGGDALINVISSIPGRVQAAGFTAVTKAGPGRACGEGFEMDPSTGRCKRSGFTGAVQRFLPGGESGFQENGMRSGGSGFLAGGMEPQIDQQVTRRCGRNMVLGWDGLCYRKGSISNRDRFWPRGRRPLLTGGEMNAITKASGAARKIQRKTKQLQGLGMLKTPKRGVSRARVAAGHHVHTHHD